MEYIKLIDICKPKQWKTIPTSELIDEGYPVYGANGIIGYYKEYNHENPVITITCRGATCGAINITVPKAYVTGNAMCLDNVQDDINIKYLYYSLLHYDFNSVVSGSAQPQITRQGLEKVMLLVETRDRQERIVTILDNLKAIIGLYQQQLIEMDTLIKSRFVEIFGDPVRNERKWKTNILSNVTNKIGSGATPKGGKESYQKLGISLIRSMNVYDGRFEYKDLAHITEKQATQLNNVIVQENDVLINITGASVARSCIVPNGILPARVNQHVSIIRCQQDIINYVFINNMFQNDSFKSLLLDIGESGGATRQAITKQQLEELEVILPPLELQKQFAAFVHQIDKLKADVQKMESAM